MRIKNIGPLVIVLALAAVPCAFASPVTYATWNNPSGNTVTGTIGSIGVTYTGEINFVSHFNYFLPLSTYTSSTVSNAPTTGGMIAITGNGTTTNTFTFSQPISGLILSEVSLGGYRSTSYTFDHNFSILSCGPGAVYGGGCIQESGGNTMFAQEGDGTIGFAGTFSSLSFTTANGEYWNGFTIGLLPQSNNSPVPEPGTLVLLGTGILGLAGAVRRKLSV